MDSETLAAIRRDYLLQTLDRSDLHDDPLQQFHQWMEDSLRAQLREPTAMALATVDDEGRPHARMVLLKGADRRGFVFFTNLESRKGRQLRDRPEATLLFPWVDLERQVILKGPVEGVSVAEVQAYFSSRPRESQIGAWASEQSRPLQSREDLETEWARVREAMEGKEVPLPPFWGGFRLRPRTIEFWQGRRNRLHDRFEYVRQPDDTWTIQRLSP